MNLKEAIEELKYIDNATQHMSSIMPGSCETLIKFLQSQQDENEQLKGRTLLRDWFVIWLQHLNNFELKHENEISIEDIYGEGVHIKFTLTKIPDSDMWEMSEAGANDA